MSWLSRTGLRTLALPLAALGALTVFVISELTYHRSRDALLSVSAEAQLRIKAQLILRLILDAETGKRGYLLTGRRQYLEPYQEAVVEAEQLLRDLDAHYRDDIQAGPTMAELRDRGCEKMSELSTALAFYDEGKHDAWRELLMTDIGREKMEAVRVAAGKLFDIQNQRVAVLRDALHRNFQISRIGVDANDFRVGVRTA